jgi:hypothetical protein
VSKFWDSMRELLKEAKALPSWMGAGINLCSKHYITFSDRPCACSSCKEEQRKR